MTRKRAKKPGNLKAILRQNKFSSAVIIRFFLLIRQSALPQGGPPDRKADISPITLDTNIRFNDVGGLESHIHCLKEMVVFPMMYPDVFERFHITPPKGVLFHGPPGTGKTLIARALANECSQGNRKVAFFMRKGADCLSKWVGESERQLRLLFEQAQQMKPSIIFFDEIDGLAPVRSTKQDQIHASIVSTLLALMDGLSDRGEVKNITENIIGNIKLKKLWAIKNMCFIELKRQFY